MVSDSNLHSAAGSATGYFYQSRFALLAALREIRNRPQLSVSIELFDDVAFDVEGTPEELIQMKHHPPDAGNLTNRSVDLWKTLGIWSKLVLTDSQAPMRTQFVLLTTGEAPDGSAASRLRRSDRDVVTAADALLRAARESTNEMTKSARQQFTDLTEAQRIALLEAVIVLDSSPDISDAYDEIRAEIYSAAPRQHLDHVVHQLEGWWFARVVEGLRSGYCSIPLTEIEDKIREIQEGLSRDTLPVDCADLMVPPELINDFDARTFVRQLQLIGVGNKRISYAIRDFYRTFRAEIQVDSRATAIRSRDHSLRSRATRSLATDVCGSTGRSR